MYVCGYSYILCTVCAYVCGVLGKGFYSEENVPAVVGCWTQNFSSKYQYFVENFGRLDELFEPLYSTVTESGRLLSRCGKCMRFMKYIAAKGFVD